MLKQAEASKPMVRVCSVAVDYLDKLGPEYRDAIVVIAVRSAITYC